MTDVQFEILRALYEAKSDFGDSIAQPISNVMSGVNLGYSILNKLDNDIIKKECNRLIETLYITEQQGLLSITFHGSEMYLQEKEKRRKKWYEKPLRKEIILLIIGAIISLIANKLTKEEAQREIKQLNELVHTLEKRIDSLTNHQ